MQIRLGKKMLIKIGAWILIILIAPFAFEILLLADIVGVEAALAFLFVYLKALRDSYKERLEGVRSILLAGFQRPAHKLRFLRTSYTYGVVSSCLLLWVTGSILLSVTFWVPYGALLTQL